MSALSISNAVRQIAVDQAQDRLSGAPGVQKDADKVGDKQTQDDLSTVYNQWTASGNSSDDFIKYEAQQTGMSESDLEKILQDFNGVFDKLPNVLNPQPTPSNESTGSGDGDGASMSGTIQGMGGGNGTTTVTTPAPFKITDDQSKYLGDPNTDPKPMDGKTYSTNSSINLYPTDVDQSSIGDCYLESTMASWAASDPKAIQDAIKQNGTGPDGSPNYTVKMYDPNGSPVEINVSGKTFDGQNMGPDGKPDWATILEKGYAKYCDVYGGKNNNPGGDMKGFPGIGSGGFPTSPMAAFTGNKDPSGGSWDTTKDTLPKMEDALKDHQMVVGWSTDEFTGKDGNKYPGGHAYQVVSMDPSTSTVTLRNPWGTNGDAGGKDGTFQLSYDDYVKDLKYTNMSGSNSSYSAVGKDDLEKGAVDSFTQNGGGMHLVEGADNGKANQALKDQALAAVKAGDLTSFKSAYDTIVKSMKNQEDGSNEQVLTELNTLSANTDWKDDGGSDVIGANIQHAADALASGDWASGAHPDQDVKQLINDFNSHASLAQLNQDAKALGGDLRNTDLSTNLSAMVSQALGYASTHSDWGKGPDQGAQNSLIDGFNKAAGAAGSGSFTSNIQDGWAHIKADMSANNTDHLVQDLQWMLDHISGAGSYNDKEQAVVDAINNIAKAYGVSLNQPQGSPDYVPVMF